jgi:hypothetical protein
VVPWAVKNDEQFRSGLSVLDVETARSKRRLSASVECLLPRASTSPFTNHEPLDVTQKTLIDTPRLEVGVTPTKQTPAADANRYKNPVLFPRTTDFLIATDNPTRIIILSEQRESQDLRCQANRRLGSLPQPSKFLIANPRLKFLVSHGRSIGCNFLIANKSRFLVTEFAPPPTCGSNFPARAAARPFESVKVKSLLCYGDSHFQLCKIVKIVMKSPSRTFGEN